MKLIVVSILCILPMVIDKSLITLPILSQY